MMPLRYTLILFCLFFSWFLMSTCQDSNEQAITGKEKLTGKVKLSDRFNPDTQSYAFVIPNLEAVEAVGGVKAKDCGKCHKTIYAEWKASTHATALRDIQFQAEIAKGDSPKWICLNCHTPVQNQRPYFVTHLQDNDILQPVKIPNPKFDPEMQQEAITCAACHVRRDKNGKSYIIGPNGSPYAPHPLKKDPQFLRNICLRCHDPRGAGLTQNLICWFQTKRELQEGQTALRETFGQKSDCVACHMPEKVRHIADDYTKIPKRTGHKHHWVGGGVPKWYEAYDALLKRGYVPGLSIRVGELTGLANGEASLKIVLKNERAGHYLPTADPERFIFAVAALIDAERNSIDQKTLRIGQTWKWNPARKIGDNRLKQGEEYPWEVHFQLPEKRKGLKLAISVFHVKLGKENAKYMKKTKGIDENLFKNGTHFVENIEDYYPFASYIFKEEIDLKSKKRRKYSPEELIELSKMEKGKPINERVY